MSNIFSCACWPSVYLLWNNVCSDALPIFWLGCLFFLLLSCVSFLCIMEINPLSDKWLVNIFSCVYCPSVYLLWKNVCSHPLPTFWLGCLFFLLFICVSCFYIMEINSLSDIWFANIFSHLVGCFFILILISFDFQKLFSLMKSHLFLFFFCFPCLGRHGIQ